MPKFPGAGQAPEILAGIAGGVIDTATDCCPEETPTPFQHSKLYDVFVDKGPCEEVPLRDFQPLQSPEAQQEVALAVDHDKVDVPPEATEDGVAEKESVGDAGTVTATDRTPVETPTLFQHSKLYDLLVNKGPWTEVPFTGCQPLQSPEAKQEVALEVDHERVVELPGAIVVGFTEKERAGFAQLLFGGGDAGQVGLQVSVPTFTCPQPFGAEVQLLP